ncbi:PRTRC system protein C [Mongoliitalea daihaiensis]|uniref:PRTRC system protein C n=1 Tax=Mongoliitalea daihaiensis TaxID=2782006 RepID=UPI001F32FD9C|nr:PRTRC system protein C [Mongoliitalea daihaiensis]UJP64044.1 PRTRC system protein C [Mongoliitalea daihaiensis]
MKVTKLNRVFKFKDQTLEDPNIKMTTVQVKDFYSNEYPELVNANITEKTEGDTITVTFQTAVGKKG